MRLIISLLLTLQAMAEPIGIVASLRDGQASFWTDSKLETLQISPQLQRTLASQGLGSRWEIWASGQRLESALPRGVDAEMLSALSSLQQFAQFINHERWLDAYALLLPQAKTSPRDFQAYWSTRYLSTDRSDWTLSDIQPAALEVSIQSRQGSLDGEESYDYKPTLLHSSCHLSRQGSRWLVDAYR